MESERNKLIPATITEDEREVGDLLAMAWNKFCKLPVLHHADSEEFVRAIHAAQNIVLARVGLRSSQVYRPLPPNEAQSNGR